MRDDEEGRKEDGRRGKRAGYAGTREKEREGEREKAEKSRGRMYSALAVVNSSRIENDRVGRVDEMWLVQPSSIFAFSLTDHVVTLTTEKNENRHANRSLHS